MKEKFDSENHLCLCGSGKFYEECCKGKINPYSTEETRKKFASDLDTFRKKFKKICLHPEQHNCSKVRSHAHTISQAAVLELIAKESIVLMPFVYGIAGEFRMQPTAIEHTVNQHRTATKYP